MRITSGRLKNRRLTTLKGRKTRPTTEKMRQAVFNAVQFQIEGSYFLDLFAGSGAMGIEALSRGAAMAVFVEKGRAAACCIRDNLAKLELKSQSELIVADTTDALNLLAKEKRIFDIIYADPPYRRKFHSTLLRKLDILPLLSKEGILLIEEAAEEPFTLPPLHSLHLLKKKKMGSSLIYYYENKVSLT